MNRESNKVAAAFVQSRRKRGIDAESTGDSLLLHGDLIAWRVDGEIYAMPVIIADATLLNIVCHKLRVLGRFKISWTGSADEGGFYYNDRKLGRDEVVCITSIEPTES